MSKYSCLVWYLPRLSQLPRTLSVLNDTFFGTLKVHDVSSTSIVAHFWAPTPFKIKTGISLYFLCFKLSCLHILFHSLRSLCLPNVTNQTKLNIWLIKFNQTQSNSIIWLGSLGFGNRTQSSSHKKMDQSNIDQVRLCSIRFDSVRLQGNHKTWSVWDNIPLKIEVAEPNLGRCKFFSAAYNANSFHIIGLVHWILHGLL